METLILCIINLLCPPLAVALRKGLGEDFFINVILCLLMWVPGILHGFYVLLRDE